MPMEYVLGFLLLNIGLLPLWGIFSFFTQTTVMVDDEQKTCYNLRNSNKNYRLHGS
jgi:hypothetical protein